MTRERIEEIYNGRISDEDYSLIEHVVLWHPQFDGLGETAEAEKVVAMYRLMGADIFREMAPRADLAEEKCGAKIRARLNRDEAAEKYQTAQKRFEAAREEYEAAKAELEAADMMYHALRDAFSEASAAYDDVMKMRV